METGIERLHAIERHIDRERGNTGADAIDPRVLDVMSNICGAMQSIAAELRSEIDEAATSVRDYATSRTAI
jgi:hypothetical protein